MDIITKNLTSLIALVGIILTYYIFRNSLVQKRNNYLKSIKELLNCTSYWLNTSYDKNYYDSEWRNPTRMVYRINANIIDSIIVDSGVIFDSLFVKRLVQFSQLITKFNQFIDAHMNYVNSSPEIYFLKDIKNENKEVFLKSVEDLMKRLHIEGIGANSYQPNSDYPYLHKCFLDLGCYVKCENKVSTRFLYWDKLFKWDLAILATLIFFIITIVLNK